MSKSITLALALTGAKPDLPAGRAFGGFRFTIVTPGVDPTSTTTSETTVTFSDAPPGIYTASVEPVDANGDALEAAVVVEVTVPEDVPPAQFPSVAGATLSASVA